MRRRWLVWGMLPLLLFPPVFLVPVHDVPSVFSEAEAGVGNRIRRISRSIAIQVVSAALAGVSTSLLQVEAAVKRAQQLKYAVGQYQQMLKNAKRLTGWERQGVQDALLQLDTLAKQGKAIAYSAADLDKQFRAAYQGFTHHRDHPRTRKNRKTYADLYRDWVQRGHDSIRGALRTAGLQSRQFKTETARMRQLETQLMSAAGTQQALQAGYLIASHQVSQLQKLRQLMMSQMQIQGNFAAVQLDRQALEDATLQRLLAPSSTINPNPANKNYLPSLPTTRGN